MYFRNTRRSYPGGSQRSRGYYLVVAGEPSGEMRGIARVVTLSQCGHWMMGRVEIAGCVIPLSGGMGNDGSPLSQEKVGTAWDHMVLIPEEIATAYWKTDDGWNCVGYTAPRFVAWAESRFKDLTKPIRKQA